MSDVERVNQEIANICQWSQLNNMVLNPDKTSGLVNYRGSFKETCDVEDIIHSVKFQPVLKMFGCHSK